MNLNYDFSDEYITSELQYLYQCDPIFYRVANELYQLRDWKEQSFPSWLEMNARKVLIETIKIKNETLEKIEEDLEIGTVFV